jgi:hypothetical protein
MGAIPSPFCAELILPQAVNSKHCKSFLTDEAAAASGVDPEEADRVRTQAAQPASAASEPAETAGEPPKVTRTMVVGPLLAGAIGLGFWGLSAGPTWKEGWGIFGIVLGIVLLIVWMAADITVPACLGRADSRKGALCFLRSVQYGRWRTAFACLSPIAKESAVEIPYIPEIQSPGGTTNFSTAGGLKRYWAGITRPGGFGLNRRVASLRLDPVAVEGEAHRFEAAMSIEYYPGWILVTFLISPLILLIQYLVLRKTHSLTFDMAVGKHKSQWWVVTGQIGSPFDRLVAPGGAAPNG